MKPVGVSQTDSFSATRHSDTRTVSGLRAKSDPFHTHEQVSYEVQRVMADDGHPVQGGDWQVLTPQQLLQKPDQGAEDAEVGRSAVGHQLVVTLETHSVHNSSESAPKRSHPHPTKNSPITFWL